jgi:hypothetical protein
MKIDAPPLVSNNTNESLSLPTASLGLTENNHNVVINDMLLMNGIFGDLPMTGNSSSVPTPAGLASPVNVPSHISLSTTMANSMTTTTAAVAATHPLNNSGLLPTIDTSLIDDIISDSASEDLEDFFRDVANNSNNNLVIGHVNNNGLLQQQQQQPPLTTTSAATTSSTFSGLPVVPSSAIVTVKRKSNTAAAATTNSSSSSSSNNNNNRHHHETKRSRRDDTSQPIGLTTISSSSSSTNGTSNNLSINNSSSNRSIARHTFPSLPLSSSSSPSATTTTHPTTTFPHPERAVKTSSPFHGVTVDKRKRQNQIYARIKDCGHNRQLGFFKTQLEAALAYDDAARSLRKQTNFISLTPQERADFIQHYNSNSGVIAPTYYKYFSPGEADKYKLWLSL